MTFFYILLGIYVLSLMVVSPIHWAMYQDDKKKNPNVSMVDKVMHLYVVPFCPVVNTILGVNIIGKYLDNL